MRYLGTAPHASSHCTAPAPYRWNRDLICICTILNLSLKPGFHYQSWRPELTARVDGWPVSITRQHGPCWRARVSTSRVDGPSRHATPMRVFIEVDMLKEVHTFKYIGALFGSEAICGPETKARLAMARERMCSVECLWRSQTLSNRLKARLIQTLVWPIVTELDSESRSNQEHRGLWNAVLQKGIENPIRGPCH